MAHSPACNYNAAKQPGSAFHDRRGVFISHSRVHRVFSMANVQGRTSLAAIRSPPDLARCRPLTAGARSRPAAGARSQPAARARLQPITRDRALAERRFACAPPASLWQKGAVNRSAFSSTKSGQSQSWSPVAPSIYVCKMPPKGIKHSADSEYTKFLQMEHAFENPEKSSQMKKKRHSKTSNSVDSFEMTAAGAGREISMLFAKFADMLSERAAVDTAQRKELESLLQEAQNLESVLKDKKNHLKQTLVQISDKL
ncbi:uncharacterized protein LOC133504920 [Syngnathoides biaculeatus]|uniref:uncharacterized protein LOC133504920 n=1 Tax=Syngnathoides biaculeatus TaxID=300417 RepID=UPI002ADD6625|nr:uncharacterized protein LOC133504920 [Syngnathoides biaculeatus]